MYTVSLMAAPARADLDHAAAGGALEVVTAQSMNTRTDPWDPASGTTAQEIEQQSLDRQRDVVLADAWRELDALVGSPDVKSQIRRLASKVEMDRERKQLSEELVQLVRREIGAVADLWGWQWAFALSGLVSALAIIPWSRARETLAAPAG